MATLGCQKGAPPQISLSAFFNIILNLLSLTSVPCSSMLAFTWRNFTFLIVEQLKRQDPFKFQYFAYRDVMKYYANLSPSFSRSRKFIKNPLCTCWTTAIDLTGDVLAIPTRSITTEISHQIWASPQADKLFLSPLETVTWPKDGTKVLCARSRRTKSFHQICLHIQQST